MDKTNKELIERELEWLKDNYVNKIVFNVVIKCIIKALSKSNKQIEELKEDNKIYESSLKSWKVFENEIIHYQDNKGLKVKIKLGDVMRVIQERDKLKHQLQKKDNIIKGMNQIIQKKTLTKEQVFGKDKLQTQRDDMFKEIDKLVQFPKTRKEGIKRNKEFDNLYKKLFSEFDLESHPVYSYDEVRFRRAIVFGYKKALDKIREHLKQKHKEE